MSEKIYCPFCGFRGEKVPVAYHMEACRIRRFNEACNAYAASFMPVEHIIRDARALVDAIESAAKEKGEE